MALPWDGFLAGYQELAKNVAAGLIGRRDEADDVVQEAMLALIAADRKDPCRFSTADHARNYLLRAVRNLALKRRTRSASIESLPRDEVLAGHDPSEHEAWRERASRLEHAVESLDRDERDLFRERFALRKTLAQIADETGIPVSTLHSREKSLLTRLRRAVERNGEAP